MIREQQESARVKHKTDVAAVFKGNEGEWEVRLETVLGREFSLGLHDSIINEPFEVIACSQDGTHDYPKVGISVGDVFPVSTELQ